MCKENIALKEEVLKTLTASAARTSVAKKKVGLNKLRKRIEKVSHDNIGGLLRILIEAASEPAVVDSSVGGKQSVFWVNKHSSVLGACGRKTTTRKALDYLINVYSRKYVKSVHPQFISSMGTWKPDHSSSACFICSKPFSAFHRKHHCRSCGEIVCDDCSLARGQWVDPLKRESGEVSHTQGEKVRICDICDKTKLTNIHPGTISQAEQNGDLRFLEALQVMTIAINKAFPVSATRYYYNSKTRFSRWGKYRLSQKILRGKELNRYSEMISQREICELQLLHALKISIANCYEMSLAAFSVLYELLDETEYRTYMKRFNLNVSFEGAIYFLPHGDHNFLMLGNNLPVSFNSGTMARSIAQKIIVFDPWEKLIFYLSQAKDILGHDLIGQVKEVNFFKTFNTSSYFRERMDDPELRLLKTWLKEVIADMLIVLD
ncbi:MAG: hypothetical protein GY750_20750 [Lentisphaerae bacterium]|nr:hypothetical protein [Lentisphaerota bacterium]MCP4103821.1 hypothetical protein [Lentisphaerota bacterium]